MNGEIVYPLTKREETIIAWCAGAAYGVTGVILFVGVVVSIMYA